MKSLLVGSVAGALLFSLSGCTALPVPLPAKTVVVTVKPQAAATPTPAAATSDPPFNYKDAFLTVTLKTVSKQCFGSAGCNVEVKPELAVLDPSTVPDDASGTVTYEITGGDDGQVIDTIDLTGTQYTASPTVVSTSSSGVELKVKVTDIETN